MEKEDKRIKAHRKSGEIKAKRIDLFEYDPVQDESEKGKLERLFRKIIIRER